MSAFSRMSLIAAALALPAGGHADDPEAHGPDELQSLDVDMLEFLGSWEGNDEEWLDIVDMAEREVESELKVSATTSAEGEVDEK